MYKWSQWPFLLGLLLDSCKTKIREKMGSLLYVDALALSRNSLSIYLAKVKFRGFRN